jgi:hypothetical protein
MSTDTREETVYSAPIPGDAGNYQWRVRFDRTGGYLGITQYEGDMFKERVLLSPAQVKALLAFLNDSQVP